MDSDNIRGLIQCLQVIADLLSDHRDRDANYSLGYLIASLQHKLKKMQEKKDKK